VQPGIKVIRPALERLNTVSSLSKNPYDAGVGVSVTNSTTSEFNPSVRLYPFYQDVHVMIFIGFAFLMTFLCRYSFSSIGLTFLLSAICIQLSILINGLFHQLIDDHWEKIELSIESLITGDFAAATILITMGATLGRLSFRTMIVVAIIELCLYALNESIGVIIYSAVDMGGSMYVHTFGAYFGLALAPTSRKKRRHDTDDRRSTYMSDTSAMIGTIFLWLFWPSFNGALAIGNAQHRVIINTVLALTASCIISFIMSKLIHTKFEMVEIQNATLAGGVAIGSSSDMVADPYTSLIIGLIAGFVSVLGYRYLTPWLEEKIGLYDTCGVHNLHGLPGVIGGLGGAITAWRASDLTYGDSIGDIFPERANGRSAESQALYQLAALGTTLGISIVGGLITGLFIRFMSTPDDYYRDEEWLLPDEHDDGDDVMNNMAEDNFIMASTGNIHHFTTKC